MNLTAYMNRIGVSIDNCENPFEKLCIIQKAHMSSIAFENFDVVLKKTISMTSSDVEQKLVHNNRGGYCFEQSTLLMSALRSLGYGVTPMLARVRWNKAPDAITTFTHIVLIVKLPQSNSDTNDNEYLVDVGFGGIGSISPLKVGTEDAQQTDGLYRVLKQPNNYRLLQWHHKEMWLDLYTIKYEASYDIDLELSNWWSCTYPAARFTTSLFLAIVKDDARHYILNNEYSVKAMNGELLSKVTIRSVDEFLDTVLEVFKMDFRALIKSEEDRQHMTSCTQRFLLI